MNTLLLLVLLSVDPDPTAYDAARSDTHDYRLKSREMNRSKVATQEQKDLAKSDYIAAKIIEDTEAAIYAAQVQAKLNAEVVRSKVR